jgi:hypothetical protein
MALNAPQFFANGNINPSVFVKIDTTSGKNFSVIQAAASSDSPVGISQPGTYQPPGVTGSDGYAAHVNQTLMVYGNADVCLLKIGTGGCTAGDYLTSDVSGAGVTVAFTEGTGHIFHGAQALETAAAGELCRVVVNIGVLQHTTA